MPPILTSKAHREILEHSLGIDPANTRKRKPYRNYFCVSVGDKEYEPLILELIGMGLMKRGPSINDGQDYYVYVTEAGAAEVNATLPKEAAS